MSGLQSRFDWYSATFHNLDVAGVPEHLGRSIGASVSLGRGKMGYERCATLERDGESLARVYLGASVLDEVHVSVSGDACDEVVPLLRVLWPDHRVSRADSAMDFQADFALIDARVLAFAEARGIKHRLITDSDGGATRYLGAVSSEVTVRVYKKSEQLRQMQPAKASEVPDGIVRAELQARPGTKVKSAVAGMSADDLWGLGRWTKEFAETFLEIDAERVSTHFRQESDWLRALRWMGAQYGPAFRRRVDDVGEAVAVSEVLEVFGLTDAR
jgi:hypothetical protein